MALSRGPRQEHTAFEKHGGQCEWVEENWKQNNPGFSSKFDMKLTFRETWEEICGFKDLHSHLLWRNYLKTWVLEALILTTVLLAIGCMFILRWFLTQTTYVWSLASWGTCVYLTVWYGGFSRSGSSEWCKTVHSS